MARYLIQPRGSLKKVSKRVVLKTAEPTVDLTGNKIAAEAIKS